MANMGYCRFVNTLGNLRDCLDHMEDEVSPEEHKARKRLVNTCGEILEIVEVYGSTTDLPHEEA